MKTSRRHLAEVIGERTLHLRDHKLLAKEVAAYLLSERRTADFGSLIRDIMQYRAGQGIIEATAISAHDLNEPIMKEIKTLLKNAYPAAKSITVNERQNPAVIGGIRVDLPNEQLDLTLQAKLATFKRVTAERST